MHDTKNNIDVKLFDIATQLSRQFSCNDLTALMSELKNISRIDNQFIIESFSSLDREKFAKIILQHCNSRQDILDEEKCRAIRVASMIYMYDKYSVPEYILSMILEIKNLKDRFDVSLKIDSNGFNLDFIDESDLRSVIYHDFIYSIGKHFNVLKSLNNSNTANIYINFENIFCESLLDYVANSNCHIKIGELNKSLELFVDSLSSFIEQKLKHEAQSMKDLRIDIIKQREETVSAREAEIEKKELQINELMRKNSEFSIELQKKAGEIDMKLQVLSVKKVEIDNMMSKVLETCKKIVKIVESN